MIGPKDKNFTKKAAAPPDPVNSKEEFRNLPKYIAYRAALLREKLILTYVIGIISVLFATYFAISRMEISSLYEQLRSKEYILAPGVRDFTPATPQNVPDSYVSDAVSDFLSTLGNVNAANVREQYNALMRFMSPELRIKFSAEVKDWITQTKSEDLAQIFQVQRKEIVSKPGGEYQVTAFARADFYAAGQPLGHEDQVVEMSLKLVAPDRAKRWYLQIISLSLSKLKDFNRRISNKK